MGVFENQKEILVGANYYYFTAPRRNFSDGRDLSHRAIYLRPILV